MKQFRKLFARQSNDLAQTTAPQNPAVHQANSSNKVSPEDYPIFPPPRPQAIIANRAAYLSSIRRRKYSAPAGTYQDTPLFSLYRLYEFVLLDHVIGYRNEEEYFCKQRQWAIRDIPDPMDDDADRYAFLACCTYLLVKAFNERIKMGLTRDVPAIMTNEEHEHFRNLPESEKTYEIYPEWAKKVSALPVRLSIPTHDGILLDGRDDERADPDFLSKNILLWTPHIHFT